MGHRGLLAFGLALTAVLGLPLTEAGAVDCRFPEVKFKRTPMGGVASVIVTRVEPAGSTGESFRVEETVGIQTPKPGDVVRIDCTRSVPPGSSVALVLSTQPEWRWIGSPWNKPDEPTTPTPGPVVAVASGHYGDSRLVALDAAGRAVAWHRRAGTYAPPRSRRARVGAPSSPSGAAVLGTPITTTSTRSTTST